MDGERFDSITRAMARTGTRRQLVQGVLAGTGAGVVAALTQRGTVQAKKVTCGKKGDSCKTFPPFPIDLPPCCTGYVCEPTAPYIGICAKDKSKPGK